MQHRNFGDMDGKYALWENSDIAILPVPYDKTSTWIKGADKGPFAILEASNQLEMYDIETDYEVFTHGIHTCEPLKIDSVPEEMVQEVEEKVLELIDSKKFVVTLGGEHSVTVGSIRAYSSRIENLSLLQLDAHTDLREEYEGSKYNHACVMARVSEVCPIVQVGIRSVSVEEKNKLQKNKVFLSRDIRKNDNWIQSIIKELTQNVYVSIDLDVFDPSIMPSTGTPQPGGLDWWQVTDLLRELANEKNIVGFDVVELCPNEKDKAPDILAAKLVYKFLSYIYKNKE